jgi:hypothetical protein
MAQGRSCAPRRIVNVSGDGRESFGPRPHHRVALSAAKDRAEAMGVTVNGLAITVDDTGLSDWYRSEVITGRDAFVMTANSFDAFEEALIRKLVREIALPVVAEARTGQEGLR